MTLQCSACLLYLLVGRVVRSCGIRHNPLRQIFRRESPQICQDSRVPNAQTWSRGLSEGFVDPDVKLSGRPDRMQGHQTDLRRETALFE